MRINKYLASATGLSRRAADTIIAEGRVLVNDKKPSAGQDISPTDTVIFDNRVITPIVNTSTVMLNKPAGYVCSRKGQGSKTIYELLPEEYATLKPVGRLDKNSSGLLLMTNDGELAHTLTHPRYAKQKIYEVTLNKPLQPLHQQMINDIGISLEDGVSKLTLEKQDETAKKFRVSMSEGRNRQIRRTFAALGYEVMKLHRTHFGDYKLGELKLGSVTKVNN